MTTTATETTGALARYPGTHALVAWRTGGGDTSQWLTARRRGIGGSDIAAIMGLSRWRSALDVYMDKTGMMPDRETSEAMAWGTLLEAPVADEYARRTNRRVQMVNAVLQHPDYEWALANIDRLQIDPERGRGVLEVKTVGQWGADAWEGDAVPDAYMLQLQWYLWVTGLQWGSFAALVGGQRLITREVERDDELCEYMRATAERFWIQNVRAGVPPDPDGSAASTDALAQMYPVSEPGTEIMLDPDALALVREYERASADIKAAEERKNAAANAIKALLGEHERGLVHDAVITWRTQSRASIDAKRLRADHPALADEYTTETTSRVFTIKKGK